MGRYKITPTIITYPRTFLHCDMVAIIDPLTRTYWLGGVEFEDEVEDWIDNPTRLVRGWNSIVQPGIETDMDAVGIVCEANNRNVTMKYSLEEYIRFVKLEHALFRENNKKKGTK